MDLGVTRMSSVPTEQTAHLPQEPQRLGIWLENVKLTRLVDSTVRQCTNVGQMERGQSNKSVIFE